MTDATDSGPRDVIPTVVKRAAFLDRLADGPASKRDLRDELNLSRSTVYKAVRELEDNSLATEADDEVRLTLVGHLLAEEYRAFEERVSAVHDREVLLSVLPADAPVSADLLTGAKAVLAERHAPTRPVAYIDELVRSVDHVVGVVPVVLPQYVDLFYEEIVQHGLSADLVMEAPVVEFLWEDHGEKMAEALETGRLSVRQTDETLPFGLIATEREGVVLIVYDESGELRGILLNDTEAALDWGGQVFQSYWDRTEEADSA